MVPLVGTPKPPLEYCGQEITEFVAEAAVPKPIEPCDKYRAQVVLFTVLLFTSDSVPARNILSAIPTPPACAEAAADRSPQ